MNTMMPRAIRLAAPVLALATLGACRDHETFAPPVNVNNVVPFGVLQPIVLREPGARSGESVLIVRVHGAGIDVGAYQGELTFDTTTVHVLSVETPSIDGEFRVVNDADAASGRIRFAAFTAERLSDEVAFRVTVRHSGTWESAAVRAKLDVAGDGSGAAIVESALRGTSALYDARTGAVLVP